MTDTTVERPGPRALAWLGLLISLGGPVLVIGLLHSGVLTLPLLQQRAVVWIGMWGLALILVLLVARGEKRPLASIGLGRFTIWSLVWGVVAGLAAIIAFPLCAILLKLVGVQSQTTAAGVTALAALPLWARLATLATAGFCEEVLYRGYPISRIRELTGSRILAFLVPAVVFIALHAPSWGFAHLLYVSVVTVIMTGLFAWRRDLWSNIIAHLLTDAVPLILFPLMMVRR